MKKILFLLLIFTTSIVAAQEEKGIQFEHGVAWSQIKAKAKAENKYIFLDAFTTWCGPCRMMAKNVFPLAEVGNFYNENFINVGVQLDTTKNDNEDVKSWYKDAHDIMISYEVRAFPTYLFFNPDGKLVHRAVGSSDPATFIAKGKAALIPEKQYYTLKKQYEEGKKDPEFLLALSKAAREAYDEQFFQKIINEYLATQDNLYTKDNLELLASSTTKSTDPGFTVFREHPEKADSILGNGKSAEIVRNIAIREVVYPAIYNKGIKEDVDWKMAEDKLKIQYPDMAEEILLPVKANHYSRYKNWPQCSQTLSLYISKYADHVNSFMLNNIAWTIFQNCDDMKYVQAALDWSKKTLSGKDERNPMFMDTYANLLYKAGKKEDAIKMEQEAVTVDHQNKLLQTTLEKMEKGEKTW